MQDEKIRILLSGCNGSMGRVISGLVAQRPDCCVAAGIDKDVRQLADYPVFSSPDAVDVAIDVLIDFSHPSLFDELLDYACVQKKPAVLATTGLSLEQTEKIEAAAAVIPVFRSANMSLGVNLMLELIKKAALALGPAFDIEIIERHHNQKVDAPSGTALMLADGINTALDTPLDYVYDRHLLHQKRTQHEIGIHSIRGGTIVGEHEVLFAGHNETLSIQHAASSKEVFAAGAVRAALYLYGQPVGLYDMSSMLRKILD